MICKRSKSSFHNKVTILHKICIHSVVTYASVVFVHAIRTHINSLQVIQSRFCRIAVGTPSYVRNGDLNVDLNLVTIRRYLKEASECYFDKVARLENPLIVAAANYLSNRDEATQNRRRPKHVLLDAPGSLSVLLGPPSTGHRPRPARR